MKILDEKDLIGLNQHPFPEGGTAIGKTLEEVIDYMMKDETIPLTDQGELKLKAGEKKNKRFKFHNAKSRELNLEVFSNMPAIISITTDTVKVPFSKKKVCAAPVKFVVNAPYLPCITEQYIAIFEKDEAGKLIPLELYKFKL